MIAVLSKPADQIGVADIQELIDSQVPEGQEIEFKETLPTDGSSPDRWVTHSDRIGRRAKHKILEESVAFANAYGGALVLGIAESDTKPPVAARITPVPRCADLAERLRLVFRDGVDPQIPSLEIFAVPTDGVSGVAIIRVGKSRMAPHRVEPTRRCTIRRSDRCEPMSMREIQDLTLNLSRGLERLNRRLEERSGGFQQEFERLHTPERAFGVRVTAVPVIDEIMFDRVYNLDSLHPPFLEVSFFDRFLGRRNIENIDAPDSSVWRPMLRAARSDFGSLDSHSRYSYNEIHCDGLVESVALSCGDVLLPGHVVANFAIVAAWCDRVRKVASAPTVEYALDVEICVKGKELSVAIGYRASRSVLFPGEEHGKLREGQVRFPRYSLSDPGDILLLITAFERDFWNLLGKDFESSNFSWKAKDGGYRLEL